ncbi:MAG TPA: DUF1501 domain-containing protein [Chthoniobacterales bacterium]|nr:DUF1501 domain-containing protein [Chthoniobacterales bacterium]
MKTEITLQTRRKFLRTSMLGAAASWTLPIFLEKTFFALDALAADAVTQTVTGKDGTILVVLQMAGGNDGLNMVVPFADDAYHAARPRLRLTPDQVLKINNQIGLNPKLSGIKSLYDEGHAAVVQGVGYPNPNRSHFRSTEIWQTASDADRTLSEGWLGRYFDNCCSGSDPTVGVAIGEETPQAFAAKNPTGVTFSRPEQFRFRPSEANNNGQMSAEEILFRQLNEGAGIDEAGSAATNAGGSIGEIPGKTKNDLSTLDFLQRTALDAQLSSDKILAIARKYKSTVPYPQGQLAASLNIISRMIAGGLPTRVYYASQGGFDTHAGQINTHERLMGEFNDAVSAFVADLKQQGNFDRVLLMTFSEFGRRVQENANGGTDHGAAAPMFLLGGAAKAGLFGQYPSLTDLDRGDLKFNTDFRSVYGTLLDRWLKAPSQTVLGRKFPVLGIV